MDTSGISSWRSRFCTKKRIESVSGAAMSRSSIVEGVMANTAIGTNLGRGLALATALVATVAFTATPKPAEARIGTGAAIGLGLGAFALGTAVGSAASPYYGYGGYGGYY